jgi:MFS family permease
MVGLDVTVLAVDLAAMAFGLPVALYPELAERTYGGPPGGGSVLGMLYAAYPAGVFLAGLFSGGFTRARRFGALMASAAIAWGATVVLLGAAPIVWLGAVALFAGGAVNFVLSTFRNAISQAYTDDALLGRIQGIMTVVLVGGPQLAGLLHGYGGALLGARAAVALGGLLTVTTVIIVVRLVPDLWSYTVEPTYENSGAPRSPDTTVTV